MRAAPPPPLLVAPWRRWHARRPRVSLDGGLRLKEVVRAADGTRKLVFELTGGEAAGGSVETVLIPVIRQRGLRDRLTICVSSQVGAARLPA
jgi:adenine C2-methylase RlmN of 23S rRNA A2503 and tRNA A37